MEKTDVTLQEDTSTEKVVKSTKNTKFMSINTQVQCILNINTILALDSLFRKLREEKAQEENTVEAKNTGFFFFFQVQ